MVDALTENEDEENKKTPETESYEEHEGEAMEDIPDASGLEEVPVSEESPSADICEVARSSYEGEVESTIDTYEERKKLILKEKWLSVTGKKPRNIPNLRKHFDENVSQVVFFGDRRPQEVERKVRERILATTRKIQALGLTYGKVLKEIRLPALFGAVLCVRFEPNRKFLFTSDRKGLVQMRDIATGEELLVLKTMESSKKMGIRCMKFDPEDSERLYVAGDLGCIQVFDLGTNEFLSSSEPLGMVNNMDVSPTGNYLVTVGREGNVNVVDRNTFQVISHCSWPSDVDALPYAAEEVYHRMRIYGLRFHPRDNFVFATGGWDNTVKIWDVRSVGAIRCIKGPAIYGDGLDISGDTILTASWRAEDALNLYDFLSGRLIKNIPLKVKSTKYEGEFLYSCKFFQDDPAYPMVSSNLVALGGSGFPYIITLNIKTHQVEQYFPAYKPVLGMDVSGDLVAYGGKESLLRIGEVQETGRKTLTFKSSVDVLQ